MSAARAIERKPEWEGPWMVEKGSAHFYLCNDGWHIFKTCGDSVQDQENAERLATVLNICGHLSCQNGNTVADAFAIVRHVYCEGDGREFFPLDLSGEPNELFEKAQVIVQRLEEAEA